MKKGNIKNLQKIPTLTNEKRISYILEASLEELQTLANEIIAETEKSPAEWQASKAIINMIKNERVQQNPNLLRQNINKLLQKFPEPAGIKLAIDRKFETQKARLDAIIDDINYRRLPLYRYNELVYENLYNDDPNHKSSRTFLAYAFTKLFNSSLFLLNFKIQLEEIQFKLYMETPMLLAGSQKTIDLRGLYLEDHRPYNIEELKAINENLSDLIEIYHPQEKDPQLVTNINNINNVNTHNISSHRSADESHVAAFKLMINLAIEEGRKSLLIQNEAGHTPLYFALIERNIEAIEAILKTKEGRESLVIRDRHGRTLLHFVVKKINRPDILKIVFETEEGKNFLKTKDHKGKTALDYASNPETRNYIEQLIQEMDENEKFSESEIDSSPKPKILNCIKPLISSDFIFSCLTSAATGITLTLTTSYAPDVIMVTSALMGVATWGALNLTSQNVNSRAV